MIRFKKKGKLSNQEEENRFKQIKEAAIVKRRKTEIIEQANRKKEETGQ